MLFPDTSTAGRPQKRSAANESHSCRSQMQQPAWQLLPYSKEAISVASIFRLAGWFERSTVCFFFSYAVFRKNSVGVQREFLFFLTLLRIQQGADATSADTTYWITMWNYYWNSASRITTVNYYWHFFFKIPRFELLLRIENCTPPLTCNSWKGKGWSLPLLRYRPWVAFRKVENFVAWSASKFALQF